MFVSTQFSDRGCRYVDDRAGRKNEESDVEDEANEGKEALELQGQLLQEARGSWTLADIAASRVPLRSKQSTPLKSQQRPWGPPSIKRERQEKSRARACSRPPEQVRAL